MKNYCDKNDDGICLCPVCSAQLDERDNLKLQTEPSNTLPDYEKGLECPECGSVCVCREGSPKVRLRPPRG